MQTVYDSKLIKWISNHKSITAIIVYGIVLFIIGTSNSRHGYYLNQFFRQISANVMESAEAILSFCSNNFQKLFG